MSVAMPVIAASRCGPNFDDRPRADLESGLTDGRRDSKAIEHLAAAAATPAVRVGDVGRWPS